MFSLGEYEVLLMVTDDVGNTATDVVIINANEEIEDVDGDGVADELDNCPTTPNADQLDVDADGIGDACEEATGPTDNIWLEAECALVGSSWQIVEDDNASGGQYAVLNSAGTASMGTAPGDVPANRLRFYLEDVVAGDYHIFGRVSAASANDDSFWIRINGGSWIKWYQGFKQDGLFNWSVLWNGPYALPAGTSFIDIAYRETKAKFDKLHLNLSGRLPEGFGRPAVNCDSNSEVNKRPIAIANVDISSGDSPLNVMLDGSASTDVDGQLVEYLWEWKDGSTKGRKINQTFTTGEYTIKLTVTDDKGAKHSDFIKVTVDDPNNPYDNEFWLEAECAIFGNSWSEVTDIEASGGTYVFSLREESKGSPSNNPDNIIKFLLQDVEPGAYNFYARVATANAGDDSFWVRLNGGEWVMWYQGFNLDGQFHWNNVPGGTLSLQAGSNVFEIGVRENGAKVDKLYLSIADGAPDGIGLRASNCNYTPPPANQPPVAVAKANPASGDAPLLAMLDAGDSYDSDGSIVSYDWTWTGGEASGAVVQTTFPEGVYRVKLTVTDNLGASHDEIVVVDAREFKVDVNDSFWLEAECAMVGQNWSTKKSMDVSGGAYVQYINTVLAMSAPPEDVTANRIRFSVDEAVSGNYYMYARLSAATSGDDSFWIRVDGGEWVRWTTGIIRGGDFHWNKYVDGSGTVKIGENSIIDIAFRENGIRIDKLHLSLTDRVPAGMGEAAVGCGEIVENNSRPIAIAKAIVPTGFSPLEVTLDGTASSDLDGTIVDYDWKWDGGRTSGGKVIQSFNQGIYAVTLTVTDNVGSTESDVVLFEVERDNSGSDTDSDGIIDAVDNCPFAFNPEQIDTDGDGTGDTCDNEPSVSSDSWMEAECFSLGVGWVRSYSSLASGGMFIEPYEVDTLLYPASEDINAQVETTFQITEDGAYNLFARIDAKTDGTNSAFVKIDGGEWISFKRRVNTRALRTSGFQWVKVNDLGVDTSFNLKTGTHTLAFSERELRFQIDKLVFTKSETSPIRMGGEAVSCRSFTCDNGSPQIYYRDIDGDGFGDKEDYILSCYAIPGFVDNNIDNCPSNSNSDQADQNGDGIGDACDISLAVDEYWIEAECSDLSKGWTKTRLSDASNEGYIEYKGPGGRGGTVEPTAENSSQIDYSISIKNSGEYFMYMRVDGMQSSLNSAWIRVDEGSWVMLKKNESGNELLTFGWEWIRVNNDGQPVSFDLTPGEHTITIADRERRFLIDKLYLSTVPTAPVGKGKIPTGCDLPECELDGSTALITSYADFDGDGRGDPNNSITSCEPPKDYVLNEEDVCPELYGGELTLYFEDADGDGFGNPEVSVEACQQPIGYVRNSSDNCPYIYNPDQVDDDNDGVGDNCIAVSSKTSDFWLEAECAEVGSAWRITNDANASSGKYVVRMDGVSMGAPPADESSNYVRFSVKNAISGSYRLYGRIKARTPSEDSFWIRINQGTWVRWSTGMIRGEAYNWNEYVDGDVLIQDGDNTIDIAYRENGVELDKIYLAADDATAPTGLGLTSSNCTQTVGIAMGSLASTANEEPQLIVNEFSYGKGDNQEYVEILVNSNDADCKDVDLRDFILDDNNGNFSRDGKIAGTGITPGHIRFADIDAWARVPVGSIILIYNEKNKNNSIQLDNDPYDRDGDRVYVLPSDSRLLIGQPSSPSIRQEQYRSEPGQPSSWQYISSYSRGDGIQLLDASGGYIHGISYGRPSHMTGGPDRLHVSVLPGEGRSYLLSAGEYSQSSGYTVNMVDNGGESPGVANNKANQQFIANLCNLQVEKKEIFDSSLEIYPNPIQGNIKVSYGSVSREKAIFLLSNNLGVKLGEWVLEVNLGMNQLELSLDRIRLSPGVYQLTVVSAIDGSLQGVSQVVKTN